MKKENIILDLKRKNRNLGQWKNKLSLMLKYARKMGVTLPIYEVLKLLAEETKEILNADRCSVLLLDREKKQLKGKVAQGIHGEELTFSGNKGLAGFSAMTGKIVNVKDAYKDKRFNLEIDKKTGYRTKTVLCFPMKNHFGEVIGVFQVLNKRKGCFNKEDEELLRILSAKAAVALENAQLYDELRKSFESVIKTLVATIDARDPMTAGHSHRVTEYSMLIAEQLGIPDMELQLLQYASILHDLGKIGIREAVLTKPGSLTDEEYKHIQDHVVFTRKILEKIYFQKHLTEIPFVASSHHERIDGSGYLNSLKGNDIHMLSKIIAVADVFDAITNKRHYRNPMPIVEALTIIKKGDGLHFDSECVKGFMRIPLDKLIKVLGKDIIYRFDAEDLERFSNYTVGGLFAILQKQKPQISKKEIKLIQRFNYYYLLKRALKDEKEHKRD